MAVREHHRSFLQLEMLETRTLLAGVDDAIVGSGDFLTNYDPSAIESHVTIVSTVGGELTIDSAALSDKVTDLKISGFDTVTITGSDKFSSLDLSHVGKFLGSEIKVVAELEVRDVGSLTLQSIAGVAWLYGNDMRLEVADARSATIVSNLHRLTLNSQNDIVLLADAQQEIRIEYEATQPRLILPADNVSFVDTASNGVTPPTDGQGNDGGSQPPPPTVLIVSLSTPGAAEFLKAALKSGDTETVKDAFAEYLKAAHLDKSVVHLAFPVGAPAEIKLAELGLLTRGDTLFDPLAQPNAGESTLHPLPVPEALTSNIHFIAPDEVKPLPEGSFRETRSPGSAELNPTTGTAITPASQDYASKVGANDSRSSLLDDVRLTLSAMAPTTASNFGTVSAYIINDLGSKFEPGVLPGLLVDAKLSRMRRETSDWIEL